MVLFQNKIVYMSYLPPGSRQPIELPQNPSGHLFEKLTVRTVDNCTLEGISVRRKESLEAAVLPEPKQVLLYFHGNAGNVGHRIPVFATFTRAVPDIAVVAFDYRGYGGSTGSPSEKGLQQDSLCILNYVEKKFPHSQIFLYGHSLGGAVAAYLAHQVETRHPEKSRVAGLVLENTFTSIMDMVHHLYPAWLPYRYLAKWFLWNRWESETLMKQMRRTPVLILSSQQDAIVPTDMMLNLWKSLELSSRLNTSKIVKFPYGTHENTYQQSGFKEEIRSFIAGNSVGNS
ncbi:alpha/beta-hydrolase [Basidiobolus meristosporus CBS 931.73]|uniref:Alpha/beta-hydrolase n=1 Tax=Basidiobolus meristosporus CBS 931.73 TaxID=1314790 RepID=A0A1Y1YZB3_9FUNG|nr:alpha/beta-hydrolase [Basidiobolus meristosporus CBS 931.73]|eukprot:ORY02905.1 alpha/beta-hydrolase [Basidiobolus meristosporus CBS 931.73]